MSKSKVISYTITPSFLSTFSDTSTINFLLNSLKVYSFSNKVDIINSVSELNAESSLPNTVCTKFQRIFDLKLSTSKMYRLGTYRKLFPRKKYLSSKIKVLLCTEKLDSCQKRKTIFYSALGISI